MYGDGWSPLMAAALADRHAIAVRLLQSAGHEAWMLTHAINKYGQTAAHLAARKGSHMLLMALINAGGRSIATVSLHRPAREAMLPLFKGASCSPLKLGGKEIRHSVEAQGVLL